MKSKYPSLDRESLRKQERAERIKLLYEKVAKMLNSHKSFRDPTYTAKRLSDELNVDGRKINTALRTHTGMSFCAYLNSLRLQDACSKLANPRFAKYTIEEIGLSVGFISRQNFYLVFTREIGCTPRDYKLRHLPENVGQCDSD
jgi:AraC-like DNA-binding protein